LNSREHYCRTIVRRAKLSISEPEASNLEAGVTGSLGFFALVEQTLA